MRACPGRCDDAGGRCVRRFSRSPQQLDRISEQRQLHEKLDQLKQKIKQAEQHHDLALAADLQYYAVPEVKARIAELNAKADKETEDTPSG